MKKPKPTFDWDQIDALRESNKFLGISHPEGAMTTYDYMERYGISRNKAVRELRVLVKSGELKSALYLKDGKITRFYYQ